MVFKFLKELQAKVQGSQCQVPECWCCKKHNQECSSVCKKWCYMQLEMASGSRWGTLALNIWFIYITSCPMRSLVFGVGSQAITMIYYIPLLGDVQHCQVKHIMTYPTLWCSSGDTVIISLVYCLFLFLFYYFRLTSSLAEVLHQCCTAQLVLFFCISKPPLQLVATGCCLFSITSWKDFLNVWRACSMHAMLLPNTAPTAQQATVSGAQQATTVPAWPLPLLTLHCAHNMHHWCTCHCNNNTCL